MDTGLLGDLLSGGLVQHQVVKQVHYLQHYLIVLLFGCVCVGGMGGDIGWEYRGSIHTIHTYVRTYTVNSL